MIQVLPVNDIKEHSEDARCLCQPTIQINIDGDEVLIHNSFDGREATEQDIIQNSANDINKELGENSENYN